MTTQKATSILVCGHGSRDPAAIEEFTGVVGALRNLLPGVDIDHGFLELAAPSISEALESMYKRGCRNITALPGMLFAAAHVKEDIPEILSDFGKDHPDVEISLARELGLSDNLIEAASKRINSALDQANEIARLENDQTVLMVVGRGSRDKSALGHQEEISARLGEICGLKHFRTCYASVASPQMDEALRDVVPGRFKRIVFLPWFLFTGVVVNRLQGRFREISDENPAIDFVEVDYFGNHPLVAQTFADRYRESISL
ncbi:MAG: sirohydrochlorin chelatase [Alphaproteobacteria bacterium]|jgi:sirohydrochlorin cobaltochelatase|nr:sirohydrochlorin chelatase [Alphaproteobacteria bacterium]MBT4084559.1 sirohydrochlorin chelatase [Alphaproteobacteria bacterium]MBT4544606.1 sirohydrochlorin chelatase [Alphaproteobacteria bacterium]MBT7745749.1 sirohydrochlorin chelatase [Alphaproteobacteria bacterium]